jgi:hypothetical protein
MTRPRVLSLRRTVSPWRTGYETFTGKRLPVVFDQVRADAGLPPWTSVDGRYFADSQVVELSRS